MSTMRLKFLAAAILGAVLTAAAPAAHATSMVQLTTDQLVDYADSIVLGVVTEVWTETDERGMVWTRTQVEISDVLKGDPMLDAVVVNQPGGVWAGRLTVVDGVARFSPGEEVLLFLQATGEHMGVVGLMQGKYTVRMDPYTHSRIVVRQTIESVKPYDHRFLPLPPADRRVTLDDFEARIIARVYAGDKEVR